MMDIITDENTILTRRKHWLVITLELLGSVSVLLLPAVIYFFIMGQEFVIAGQTYFFEIRPALFIFLSSLWLLLFWMRAVHIWTDYYLDVWTVTDRHIIDREQNGLFNRQTSVFRIDRIQDITIETKGIFPTLFHFGDIHVQTAGEAQKFIMRGIADPKYVREVILAQQDRDISTPSVNKLNH